MSYFPALQFKILVGQPSTLLPPLFFKLVPNSWQLTSSRQTHPKSAGCRLGRRDIVSGEVAFGSQRHLFSKPGPLWAQVRNGHWSSVSE